PPGITFDSFTRTLSGTSTAAGLYVVTVVATDDGTPPRSASCSFQFTVFQAPPVPTLYQQLKSFGSLQPASSPHGRVIQGTDGALYGTTLLPGFGRVFRMNSDGTGFTVLKDLDNSTTGGSPKAGLMQGSDGALYGTASTGGSHD